jgi:hypothetical protein
MDETCDLCNAAPDSGDLHRVAYTEGARAVCAQCLGQLERQGTVCRCEICGQWILTVLAIIRERPQARARVVSCDDPACEDSARDWVGNAEIFGRKVWLNIRP